MVHFITLPVPISIKPEQLASHFLSLFVFTATCFAQNDSIQNLYFVKKNNEVSFEKNDYEPGKKAFYIYRNCIYNIVLKNKKELSARVIDIRNDSIYYTSYLNENAAAKSKDQQDTLSLHPSQLKKIKMIGDRMLGLYAGYSLKKSRYVFERSAEVKSFRHLMDTVYTKDSSRSTVYEVVPYLTAQGIDLLYEQCGITYYYRGITEQDCEDSLKKKKPHVIKKGVWFTPSNANEIKGVNIGLQTMHFEDDSLAIRGVNLNADMLSFFVGVYGLLSLASGNNLINFPDTIDKSNIRTQVSGLSLSAGGLVGDMNVKGVCINGGICAVTETNGLVITGSQNLIPEFRGCVISALRNRSIKGRGLQAGLLNICKEMKGIQLGLWNVNSKRRLPLINWSF